MLGEQASLRDTGQVIYVQPRLLPVVYQATAAWAPTSLCSMKPSLFMFLSVLVTVVVKGRQLGLIHLQQALTDP